MRSFRPRSLKHCATPAVRRFTLLTSGCSIWDEAISRSAVLVTKDRDFPIRRAASDDGPAILWVRVGNISNRTLIELALQALPAIIDAIERNETVVEFVGH
jgi:predicted nuclease of predicted toxin-antitoxin system